MTEPTSGITFVAQATEMQIATARVEDSLPRVYRLVRFRTEEGATHLKLQASGRTLRLSMPTISLTTSLMGR